MLEQPVRARDVVEIDGNHGTIETTGARSTQIRSTDGRHIIVPIEVRVVGEAGDARPAGESPS